MIEIIVSLFILLGALFMLLGSVAIIRLPDTYTRVNAATKASTLGVIGTMVAVFLYFLFAKDILSGKILLTIIFVFMTAPISGLMIARSAFHNGVPFWDKNKHNDLKVHLEKKQKVNQNS
ncbi:monovalent cation/H(+) antiporter subunit G [Aquibacillus sediminis]|uniref:monovalent cation/H(+) antiporter subunit G n=1 Tax=Aquibacillus sediminis TaxID=2574734 RepID=UPI00319E3822